MAKKPKGDMDAPITIIDDDTFNKLMAELAETPFPSIDEIELPDFRDMELLPISTPDPIDSNAPLKERAEMPDDPAQGLVELIRHYRVIHHRTAVREMRRLYDRPGDLIVTGLHGRTGLRFDQEFLERFRKLSNGRTLWSRQNRIWRWVGET